MRFILVLYFFCFISLSAKEKYDLACAAIFQDEARFLREWIEFHKTIGVKHFYLYNNLSNDDYFSVLAPYVASREVELIEWPFPSNTLQEWNPIQCRAYMDAITRSLGKAKWVAFIDTDEFIVLKKGQNLAHLLKNYEDYGALSLNWQIFGHSNVQKLKSEDFLVEKLTLKGEPLMRGNFHVKSIVQPKHVKSCHNPHFFKLEKEYEQVTTSKTPFYGAFSPTIDLSIAQINHYWVRDIEYMENVKIARQIKWGGNVDATRLSGQDLNRIEDLSAYPFLLEMKRRLSLSIDKHL